MSMVIVTNCIPVSRGFEKDFEEQMFAGKSRIEIHEVFLSSDLDLH